MNDLIIKPIIVFVLLIEIAFAIHVNNVMMDLCGVATCLRKCCPRGQFLRNKTCETMTMEASFNFSVMGVDETARIQDGIVECSGEGQSRFMLDETDEFYVEGNSLVWPFLNLTVSYSYYCVDMIDDLSTPKALICYGAPGEEDKMFYCSGNTIMSCQKPISNPYGYNINFRNCQSFLYHSLMDAEWLSFSHPQLINISKRMCRIN